MASPHARRIAWVAIGISLVFVAFLINYGILNPSHGEPLFVRLWRWLGL